MTDTYPLPPLEDRVLARMLLSAERDAPDAPAIAFLADDVAWSYSELAAACRRVAGGLRALGLERGDRVGIMLPNRPEFLLAWFGTQLAGMVDAAINHELVGELLAHDINVAGLKAVVCEAAGAEAIQAIARDTPTLRLLITPDGVGGGHLPVASFDAVRSGEPLEEPAQDAREIACIRYTSGTTGHAKAIGMTHSQMAVFAGHSNWLMDSGPGERMYTCFPLHHSFASMLAVVASFQIGACCVIDRRFSASRFWSRVVEADATRAQIIPPLLALLRAQPPSPADTGHRCRWLWTGFDDPEFEARFQTTLVPFYGQSEGSVIAYIPPGETHPPGSAGTVNPLFELRVVDELDEPVAPGVEGEILWRPKVPHVMMDSYVGAPETTVAAWRGLWFHSGDRGSLDEHGRLFFIGRNSESIRRKGVNIPVESLERVAGRFPGVVEVAAIAVPSELGESEAKLCVVVAGDHPDPGAFRTHLRAHLPSALMPRYVEFRDDLPRTTTFKILKRELQAEGRDGITTATIDLESVRRAS